MATQKPVFDLITIGESLRDVFYFLHDASVSCSINKDRCLLCLEYAEKIPVHQIVKVPAAGNSANAAVGASRLGLKTALVSWVGKDAAGDDVREALRTDRVDARFVNVDPNTPTSEATILNFQGERTQLVYFQPRAYPIPKLPSTRGIYYSAMGVKHAAADKMVLEELTRQPQAFFTFQPGTTHIRSGLKGIKALIARANLLILNKDEAHQILSDGERPIMNLLEALHHLGAKKVIITDGPNGADGFDGGSHWQIPIFPGVAKERTGAGDSFATAVTVAILMGHDLPTALRWGTANSWNVVREIGPQKGLLNTQELARVLKKFSKINAKLIKH